MTIENLKQIAIKYASTKGSRIPLAPDELCNAVVQYMNSFFGVMTDINTIKVAVTEDSGNIVFTITGNTYDGKPITPIVITVDHNDFVTDQEFEEFKTTTNAAIQKNTESINSLSFRVGDTENDITTIQGQVGQINTRVGNTETAVTNLKNRVNNTETNIAEINSTLENKVDVIKNPVSNFVAYVHINQKDENISFTESAIGNTIVYRRAIDGGFNVSKGTSGQNVANMENIADVEAKIPDVSEFAKKNESNEWTDVNLFKPSPNGNSSLQVVDSSAIPLRIGKNGFYISTDSTLLFPNFIGQVLTIATTNNIPDVSNFPTLSDVNTFTNQNIFKTNVIVSGTLQVDTNSFLMGLKLLDSKIISGSSTVTVRDLAGTMALLSDIPAYTTVDSVSYDTTNGAIIAYDGAHEIHIPLQAGENVTIDASEDNKKIVISAAGGGGAGDVTAAGNNIFTGENEFRNYTYDTSDFCFVDTKEDYLTNGYTTTIKNGGFDIAYYENGDGKYWTTYADNQILNKDIDMEGEVGIKFPKKGGTFALTSDIPDTSSFVTLAGDNTFGGTNTFNNSIYAKNGVVAGDTTNYGANSVTKGSNTYSFPNKSGTFAMTTDIIKEPIYFISFYINAPDETLHLTGTMMSKNSYGTGLKTNEEFAVMLADNLYTNSDEGLAVYGKLVGLTEKVIICIYSDDGLSIRYLDEKNSNFDLPTAMFFVMETEL